MAQYTVLYDACVLYPAPLRDLLIELATANLFRAKWTDAIHEEWMRSLLANRNDLTREQLERTKSLMNAAVPDCLVTDYEKMIPTLKLPDENDRHVFAAAIRAGADAIVTTNLKHFPAEALNAYDLEAIHPDDFIQYQVDLDESRVVIAAQACCTRLKRPPRTATEYLATLESLGLSKTTNALRKYETILSPFKGTVAISGAENTNVVSLDSVRSSAKG